MFGKIINIDLTTEKIKVERVNRLIIESFIGGKGLGAYLLYQLLKGGENPLSPQNPLIFLTGPLTATTFPTSGRFVVVSKSPLTGIYADSHAGGNFGNELRRAGYDGIIIKGRSPKPKYIWINDNKIEIKNAKEIWGLPVGKTIDKLREITNRQAHIACIGPAGENLVKISSIMMDKDDDIQRAGIAGRAGLGAVMGSKNIKAITIRGSQKIKYYDEEKFRKVGRAALEKIKSDSFVPKRTKFGTSYWIKPMNEYGYLPTRNFQQGFIENGEKLYSLYMNKLVKRNVTCFNCPIRCGKILGLNDVEVKVEYESIALLGSNNGIKDIEEVAQAVHICNDLGLDTISTGNVIGFAMECAERGILKDAPRFGDSQGQRDLIKEIAYRKNLGKIMSEGVKRASEIIGEETYKFAMHVKGLELPGYEPRHSWGMALAYATSDRGGCHQRAWTVGLEIEGVLKKFSFEDNVQFIKDVQDEKAIEYSLVLCDFLPFKTEDVLNALRYSTGIDLKWNDYLKTGERIWNLIRLFNLREGLSRKDDNLPTRIFEDKLFLPMEINGKKEITLSRDEFEKALDDYYECRGWSKKGVPLKDKLIELDLDVIKISEVEHVNIRN
ncbi:MAG TPA: aldehyde ferredoxin oxidoreductase [Candidatus Atribacteria bacterium]|nr:aldehyde ferredoxin oxidoreductase [Candidatus Atribacteria bacterium]